MQDTITFLILSPKIMWPSAFFICRHVMACIENTLFRGKKNEVKEARVLESFIQKRKMG